MPHFFRERILLTPGNIPQMQSGIFIFNIAQARISPPSPFDLVVAVPGLSIGSAVGAIEIDSAAKTLDLVSAVIGMSCAAHN